MRWAIVVVVACGSPSPLPPPPPTPSPVTVSAPDAAQPIELAVVASFPGIDVVETINDARFEHGGAPASLTSMSINLEVRDARTHAIEVKQLALVDCQHAKQPLHVTGHELYTWDSVDPIAKGAASVTTPAGGPKRYSVEVAFDGVTTYGDCGYAIDLVIDRVRQPVELPLQVKRMQPMR